MPIIICLKEPQMNMMLAGDIKDEASAEYDALFPNLMVKNLDGQNVIIPLSRDCNIAFMKEATKKEVEKILADAKKRREQGQRSSLVQPSVLFPRGGGKQAQ